MSTESIFFICCAIVLSTLILTMGFSKCDMNGTAVDTKMKMCLEVEKNYEKCQKIVDDFYKKKLTEAIKQ